MSMTIKQLADSIGISKTAIRKKMTEEFKSTCTTVGADGIILVSDEGCEQMREAFRKHTENGQKVLENTENQSPETAENSVSAKLVDMLQAQLEMKDKQIAELNARLAETTAALTETTKSLRAAQALHAGTIQQQLLEESEGGDDEQTDSERKSGFWGRLFHGRR